MGEEFRGPGLQSKRTSPTVVDNCQENHSPSKALSPRQRLTLDPAVNRAQELLSTKAKETRHTQDFPGSQSTPRVSSLSQNVLEGGSAKDKAAASFSLSDTSVLCSDTPDLHSTAILQDTEISHLIDNVTLTNEKESDSGISALIGQFEEANCQAGLTVVSPLRSTSVTSDHHLPNTGRQSSLEDDFFLGSLKTSFLCSSPEPNKLASSETTDPANPTAVCGKAGSPTSKTKPDGGPSGKGKMGAVEGNLLGSSDVSHTWIPRSLTHGEDPRQLKSYSTSVSTELVLDHTLANPTLCVNSEESSLVELDGGSENLSLTTHGYSRGESPSLLASPLKPKYSQDVAELFQKGLRNGYCKQTLWPSALEIVNTIPGVNYQSIASPTCQGAGFVHNHLSSSDVKINQVCGSQQSSTPNMHVPVPIESTHAPSPALKLPSPCKSKSLGDLTSEDIACNFESKYQCISKSFVTNGVRDKRGVAMKTKSLEPLDALTEQLRKLVSFDQEDSCQALYSKQDVNQFPRALVRKLSSRSQSRVRNIATRAKEKQEASKQRVGTQGTGGGVVLRSKPSAPAVAMNRHSTGSYIAGYLRNMKAGDLEGRGIPEGACAALRYGYVDQFCSNNSVLPDEPSSDDKPEIYFLLRL